MSGAATNSFTATSASGPAFQTTHLEHGPACRRQSDLAKLRAVQEEIYRGKVLRARAMTDTQRLDEVLELSNDIFGWIPAPAGATGDEARWEEVERRLRILRRLNEQDLYRPVDAACADRVGKFLTEEFAVTLAHLAHRPLQ